MPHNYYSVLVTFRCPVCGNQSVEKMLCISKEPTPEEVARTMSLDTLKCQSCHAPLPKGTDVSINAQAASPDALPNVRISSKVVSS